jgi:hypothetical protein
MEAVVGDFVGLARGHGFSTRNPKGTITVFDGDDHLFLDDDGEVIAGVAEGRYHLSLWSGPVDTFVHFGQQPDRAGDGVRLSWSLDSVWTYRPGRARATADEFRGLYRQWTAMWVDAAESLGAVHGRIEDEWSAEEIWHLTDVLDNSMVPGVWPSWLGWSTYFGPALTQALPPLPMPEISRYVKPTPGGGQIITLLDDPAAVDVHRYWHLHKQWLAAVESNDDGGPTDRAPRVQNAGCRTQNELGLG